MNNFILYLTFFILIVLAYYLINLGNSTKNKKTSNSVIEPFIFIEDSKLYTPPNDKETPTSISYEVAHPANQLKYEELAAIDTDILRNTRVLKTFSKNDELDFYQMYNILKQLRNMSYDMRYDPNEVTNKSKIITNQKLREINTGAINTVDLELFTRMKLELISAFNNLIIRNNYILEFHPYNFFKIIESNLISQNNDNYVFTLRIGRENAYQYFTIYFDVTLESLGDNKYKLKINKVELLGIPIGDEMKFHENKRTTTENIDPSLIFSGEDDISVIPGSDKSRILQNPEMKFIDLTEQRDMSANYFNNDSLLARLEDKKINISKGVYYDSHKCFGLVNGASQELPYFKNQLFCESYHPEINQNGIWDAPCQVDTDCPFYKANKNYPNDFGKCDKATGKCQMPMGVVPIGFKKYGKLEPDCYNCDNMDNLGNVSNGGGGSSSNGNKCCGKQAEMVKDGKVKYKSPDYVFLDDFTIRKKYENELKNVGLNSNPSL